MEARQNKTFLSNKVISLSFRGFPGKDRKEENVKNVVFGPVFSSHSLSVFFCFMFCFLLCSLSSCQKLQGKKKETDDDVSACQLLAATAQGFNKLAPKKSFVFC